MKNPIVEELIKLKLISKSNLAILSPRTRDKKIIVKQDLKTKIIFLEKYISSSEYYYSLSKSQDLNKKFQKGSNRKTNVKTVSGIVKTTMLEDDYRRANQFKKFFKKKNILDFGCGWGGVLRNIKNYKSLNGVELRKECISYVKKKYKKYKYIKQY